MKMTNEYVAGFFDGEGTIIINNNKIRAAATQTNEEVLTLIKDFVKVGSVTKLTKRKEHWKDAWRYNLMNNKDVLIFLKKIEPFLIVKKKKAAEAIEILEVYFKDKDERKDKIQKAVNMISKGLSYREIEKLTGVGRQTICKNK